MKSLQVPLPQMFGRQSSTVSTAHNVPFSGKGHKHVNPSVSSVQVPPFIQGLGEQLVEVSQFAPVYPTGQMHSTLPSDCGAHVEFITQSLHGSMKGRVT